MNHILSLKTREKSICRGRGSRGSKSNEGARFWHTTLPNPGRRTIISRFFIEIKQKRKRQIWIQTNLLKHLEGSNWKRGFVKSDCIQFQPDLVICPKIRYLTECSQTLKHMGIKIIIKTWWKRFLETEIPLLKYWIVYISTRLITRNLNNSSLPPFNHETNYFPNWLIQNPFYTACYFQWETLFAQRLAYIRDLTECRR